MLDTTLSPALYSNPLALLNTRSYRAVCEQDAELVPHSHLAEHQHPWGRAYHILSSSRRNHLHEAVIEVMFPSCTCEWGVRCRGLHKPCDCQHVRTATYMRDRNITVLLPHLAAEAAAYRPVPVVSEQTETDYELFEEPEAEDEDGYRDSGDESRMAQDGRKEAKVSEEPSGVGSAAPVPAGTRWDGSVGASREIKIDCELTRICG